MKPIRLLSSLGRLLLLSPASAAVADDFVGNHAIVADPISSESGDLSVEGSLDVMGGISFGSVGATGQSGIWMSHITGQTIFQSQESSSSFLWSGPAVAPNPGNAKMLLGWDHSLTLYKSNSASPGVILNPNTGALTLSGAASGIYNSTGNPVIEIGSNGTISFPGAVTFVQRIQLDGGVLSNGQIVSGKDAKINELTVGRGGGGLINNVAIGYNAFIANVSGQNSVAIGYRALASNVTPYSNVAIGREALAGNTIGEENVAVGEHALSQNISGRENMAMGRGSLFYNTGGSGNIAIGARSLRSNITGYSNSALGSQALYSNKGNNNVGVGHSAMHSNTTGSENVAAGTRALFRNNTGVNNAALGHYAGQFNKFGSRNVMVGWDAGSYQTSGVGLETTQNSIYIGANSKGCSNSDNNAIVIGYSAVGEGANTTVIGNASTTRARIYGAVHTSGIETANVKVNQSSETQDALTVDGRTRLNGQVVITQPQGDISMGIYQ